MESLLTSGPEAFGAAKRLIAEVAGQCPEEAMPLTIRTIAERRASAEAKEGLTAFLEKRRQSSPLLVFLKMLTPGSHPFPGVISFDVISYLKLSGSRQSSRPSAVSACGYMRKADRRAARSRQSDVVPEVVRHPVHLPGPEEPRARAFFTMSSSSGRFPGGSSSTTFRTSAGSTGTQP